MFYYINIVATVVGYVILAGCTVVVGYDLGIASSAWLRKIWSYTRPGRIRELEKENESMALELRKYKARETPDHIKELIKKIKE